jgi:hypothetical protein
LGSETKAAIPEDDRRLTLANPFITIIYVNFKPKEVFLLSKVCKIAI